MQVLHKLENGKLVHEVAEEKPEEVQVEKVKFAGVEFIRKADTLLIEDEIEFIELSKGDAEKLVEVENSNFRILTDGKRFILKQDPYLHLPPEDRNETE